MLRIGWMYRRPFPIRVSPASSLGICNMNTENPEPIPIPLQQRWRDARLRFLPIVVFAVAVCAIAYLWRDHVAVRAIVGQAEPVLSNASCYKAGVLAELNVSRFQKVKAGDPIGKVLV